jgi:hypothetical protein
LRAGPETSGKEVCVWTGTPAACGRCGASSGGPCRCRVSGPDSGSYYVVVAVHIGCGCPWCPICPPYLRYST